MPAFLMVCENFSNEKKWTGGVVTTRKRKAMKSNSTDIDQASSPATDGLKVADTTIKTCRPFIIQVMVFSPKSGYKIEVQVEKSCTAEADAIWKLVFDLYKKQEGRDDFDQLVHVSYTGGTPVEQRGLEATAANGINERQADALINRAGPAVLDLEDSGEKTPEELEGTKTEVKAAAKDVANFAL
jgi:hypothetical protein